MIGELVCRLVGLYRPTGFLIMTPDKRYYAPNQDFLRQFYSGDAAVGKILPFRAQIDKPRDTRRIVIIGESAAQGTPEPAFGFARILQLILRRADPHLRIEVINAAMRGVDSTILAVAAKDLIQLRPDLFVLYIGNNEVVGLHGARGSLGLAVNGLRKGLQHTAIGQILTRIVPTGTSTQDMAYFRRHRVAMADPRRKAVYRRLAGNLDRICRLAADNRIGVVLCTVAVNLKDCPPFGSLHGPDLDPSSLSRWQGLYRDAIAAEALGRIDQAISSFEAANRIDDGFAELHFRLARCLEKAGQSDLAFQHFRMACDLDALAFRADSRINEVIRDLARRWQASNVRLVDIEAAMAAKGIPGQQYFHDHVHLNFEGDHLVACSIAPAVWKALGLDGQPGLPSVQDCAAGLAYNTFAQLQMAAGMLQTTSRPPFLDQLDHDHVQKANAQWLEAAMKGITPGQLQAAADAYSAALANDPNDWYIHRLYAYLALWRQDAKAAIDHLDAAVRLFPEHLPTVLLYGSVLAQAGLNQQAIIQYRRALRLDPANKMARKAVRSLSRH